MAKETTELILGKVRSIDINGVGGKIISVINPNVIVSVDTDVAEQFLANQQTFPVVMTQNITITIHGLDQLIFNEQYEEFHKRKEKPRLCQERFIRKRPEKE